MTESGRQGGAVSQAKQVLARGVVIGAFIAALTIGVGYLAGWVFTTLGFEEQYVVLGANVMVGIVVFAVMIQVLKPVIGYVRSTRESEDEEEIMLRANQLRRRHYYKNIAKAAVGALLSAVAAFDAVWLALYPETFTEAIGEAVSNPVLHHRFMVVAMAVGALVLGYIAVRSWRNRIPGEGDYVYEALEDLES